MVMLKSGFGYRVATVAVTLICVMCGAGASAQVLSAPAFEVSCGKQPARTPVVTYRKAAHALRAEADSSANYADLTAACWAVRYFPESEKAAALRSIANQKTRQQTPYDSLMLPLSWALEGEQLAVWSPERGEVYAQRKMALYSRSFGVPFDYMDKTLYLRICGGGSRVTVFVNGRQVGFNTDSRTEAEYNITAFVERGVNHLTLLVEGCTEASQLECQADWRLSGINRRVELLAQPKIRVFDYQNITTLDPTYSNGLLQAALLLKTELLNAHTVTVHYDLYDPAGRLVNQDSREVMVGMREVDTVRFLSSVRQVRRWTAETPDLYTVLYRIKREGRWTECAAVKVGFRQVETRDGRLLLNGQPLRIKGVVMPEFDEKTGNVVSRQTLERQIRELRMAGFNTAMTNGYPLPADFYDLADSLGLYVIDQANVSAPKAGPESSLANNPAWREAIISRAENMYQRGKNHPSILLWTLGEDSGNGYNMYESYLRLKALECYRPVAYSGAAGQWNTDLVLAEGATPAQLARMATGGRPRLAVVTAFNPGFWDDPQLQGAILGRATGAELNPLRANVRFGRLTGADRVRELADGKVGYRGVGAYRQLQNFDVELVSAAPVSFEVENRMQFRSTFRAIYTVTAKGKTIATGAVEFLVSPGRRTVVALPKSVKLRRGAQLDLQIEDMMRWSVRK